MKIRNKIFLYFSVSTIPILGLCLLLIFLVFKENREEEFQQRLKETLTSSTYYLSSYSDINLEMLRSFERTTIDSLSDEKVMIYDSKKALIYKSLDDTKILGVNNIISQLSPSKTWIETKEGDFDVIGTYMDLSEGEFYGIYKAYDRHGYSKIEYLQKILLGTFFLISLLIIISSIILSKKIAAPIVSLTKEIQQYKIGGSKKKIDLNSKSKELDSMVAKFNELLERIDLAFLFQKNAINHISHELKNPLAILVSNFEKIERMEQSPEIRISLQDQKELTMQLSEMISIILEISKKESNSGIPEDKFRIDELLFDIGEKASQLYPNFVFSIDFEESITDESQLIFRGNENLIRRALGNLMSNCIRYSNDEKAQVLIGHHNQYIQLKFLNKGETLNKTEMDSLFQPYFRGQNSLGKSGHGLGLSLVQKILEVYHGKIQYSVTEDQSNQFTVLLPLS